MSVKVCVKGQAVEFTVIVDEWVDKVEFCFRSDRNKRITRMTDISPDHPEPEEEISQLAKTRGDLLFPFVDVRPDQTCCLRVDVEHGRGVYCFDPLRCKTEAPLTDQIEIPGGELVEWENVLYVSERDITVKDCQQVFYRRPAAGVVKTEFWMLSERWSGTVSIVCLGQGRREHFSTQEFCCADKEIGKRFEGNHGGEPLQDALENAVDFLFRCKNTGDSPWRGGMYLFYDLDSHSYRAAHWNWTYGPAIGAMLGCTKNEGVLRRHTKNELVAYAKSMADVILGFENRSEGHICHGVPLGRWQENLAYEHGVMGYYSIADSGFCAKWGLMPLFQYTKEQKYLDSVWNLYMASKRWLDEYDVLPAEYLDDLHEFSDRTLDETMFVMGLFETLWKETGDSEVCDTGLRCFQALCDALKLGDGRWARTYRRNTGVNLGFERDTKGHGWAMDGLLCAAEMGLDSDTYYLKQAKDTADLLITYQYPDGHWDNFFGANRNAGVGEKSTALWSWLLYRLYDQCGEDQYRAAAQKALFWCVNQMYRGEDQRAEGSMVARSVQSGIIYRPFYPMSCSYATSFFVLAALRELDIRWRV